LEIKVRGNYLEVRDIDECDSIGNRFDDESSLDRKLAIDFQKYWEDRAMKYPEKFMWKKVNDPKLFEFYQKLSDERWELKKRNGGNGK
jgi:predicted nucleotidyltransferase